MITADECHSRRIANFGNDPTNPNQLPLMADEINHRVQNIKREAFEIGRVLNEANNIIPHGGFQNWIKENFDFSLATASNFMHVYNCCLERPQLVKDFKPSLLYILTAPKFLENVRELFFKHSSFFNDIRNKKARDIAIKYGNGDIGPDHQDVKALIKYLEERDSCEGYNNALENSIIQVNNLHATVTNAVEKISWPSLDGYPKTLMTDDQYQQISKHIKGIVKAVESILPEYEIVLDLEPEIKIQEPVKRLNKKSKI